MLPLHSLTRPSFIQQLILTEPMHSPAPGWTPATLAGPLMASAPGAQAGGLPLLSAAWLSQPWSRDCSVEGRQDSARGRPGLLSMGQLVGDLERNQPLLPSLTPTLSPELNACRWLFSAPWLCPLRLWPYRSPS